MDDVAQLLARIVADGQEDAQQRQAFRQLAERIIPDIHAMARGNAELCAKGLADGADEIADITTATLERLARDDFANLRNFLAHRRADVPGSFDSWLYGAVDFAVKDHLRRRFGRAPKQTSSTPGSRQPSRRDLGSYAARLDDQPDREFLQTLSATGKVAVQEIFAYIEAEFSPEEARALRLYFVEDGDFAQIAQELGLEDHAAALRLIRRLIARLRYRFVEQAAATRGPHET